MKKLPRLLTTAVLLLFAHLTYATVQDRHLSGFNALQLSAAFDVYITQGSTESVKVDAPGDVINKLVTEVQNGVLKIYNKDNHSWGNWSFGGHKKMMVYVTVKDLNSLSVSGSGDIFFKDGLNTNSLKIKVSGSGDVTGKIMVKTLEVGVSGSGDVKLNGRADDSAVTVSGSGEFSGRDLATNSTAVRVTGSGDASVNASEKVDAAVSGSGDVSYTGSARQVSTSKHGSGDIRRM